MNFTLGQRITNRGEDFIINDVTRTNGNWIIKAEGISELVKGKQFIFDTGIDTGIRALDPKNTRLIADIDWGYHKTKLFIENQIRNAPGYSKQITIAHKAALDIADFQFAPTLMAFDLPRPRLLIADAVGLGKTIEVGIFLSEMIKREKGKRILVLALKSILSQFQQEIWNRFAIPLVRLDSEGISKIKSELPANKNPFEYYDKTIISIDTLKNNAKFQHYIENTRWDIIVIDECHTVANIKSQRGNLAQLLSTKCESLILTSATPHNGKRENFANLINMIEPLAITDDSDYSHDDIKPYYIRRFKNDIADDAVRANFQDRDIQSIHAKLSDAEEDFLKQQQKIKFDALANLTNEEVHTDLFGRKTKYKQKKDLLFAIGLFKAYMSSPEAALKSIENRIERVQTITEGIDFVENNKDVLQELKDKLETIIALKQDTKYQRFKEKLIQLGWSGKKRDFRIVVFAERIETLKSLKEKLSYDFNLDDKAIADFHGSLSDMEQQRIIDDFGKEDSDYRILLTSDAGSQGVNLHYYCNHMFNYDIPWSLITLEQRNGRIDRYGQTKTPYIFYMLSTSEMKGLKDDLHIVNKLTEKEEAVYESLGDAASVYKLYDATEEENLVTRAVATQSSELLDEGYSAEDIGLDVFDALFNDSSVPDIELENPVMESISLFNSDKEYYQALIQQLKADRYLKEDDARFEGNLLEIKNSAEIDRILYDMPPEVKPARAGGVYQLSLNKEDVQKAIEQARKKKGEWAQFHMLYELHPVVRFLMTQLEASVDRDVALVARLSKIPQNHAYYVMHGSVANNLGQSLLSEFFVMPMYVSGGMVAQPISFEELIKKYNLNEELHTFDISEDDLSQLQAQMTSVLSFARSMHIDRAKQELQYNMEKDLAVYKEKMLYWEKTKRDQMALEFEDKPEYGFLKRRKQDQEYQIKTILDESGQYFKDLTSLNSEPYIKVIAVFYNN